MSKHRLYIDESGDHSLKGVKSSQWDKYYLCLFGFQIDEEYCRSTFTPTLNAFKIEHFGDELDEHCILHREEIAAKSPPFHVLRDAQKNSAFCTGLLKLISEIDFTAYAVVIDKVRTSNKYYGLNDYHPYHNGLLTMLERYCGRLGFRRDVGDVMAESRGGREDILLKSAYRSIYDGGSSYRGPDFFQKVLSSKEIKIKPKASNIPGLQIADLLAYPAKMSLLEQFGHCKPTTGFTREMAAEIDKKYNRRYANSQIMGYGKVFLY